MRRLDYLPFNFGPVRPETRAGGRAGGHGGDCAEGHASSIVLPSFRVRPSNGKQKECGKKSVMKVGHSMDEGKEGRKGWREAAKRLRI